MLAPSYFTKIAAGQPPLAAPSVLPDLTADICRLISELCCIFWLGQSRRDIRALMSSTDITCAVDAARITSVAWWTSAAGIGPNPRSG